jgi:transcriptional regulator with XRE-family HTH domain
VRPTLEGALDNLGRRLSELRRAKGWTQAQLAERLGVTLRDYQAVEGGRRNVTMRTVVSLAAAFGVDVRALFEEPASRAERRRGRPKSNDATSLRAASPIKKRARPKRRRP